MFVTLLFQVLKFYMDIFHVFLCYPRVLILENQHSLNKYDTSLHTIFSLCLHFNIHLNSSRTHLSMSCRVMTTIFFSHQVCRSFTKDIHNRWLWDGMGWDGMGWNASRSTNPHEQTIPTIKARWKTIHMNPQMQVGLHELHTMIILLDSRNYTGGNAGKSKGLLTGLEAQNCSHIFTGKCNCLVWEKKNLKSVW